MTASISFEVDERTSVVKIPNAALRYFPSARHVREADQKLVEGREEHAVDDQATQSENSTSVKERNALRRQRHRRHVWVVDDSGLLRAVEVITGLSDSRFTEMVEGALKPGDSVVTGQSVAG
jgi:HlyD family secretion protein